MPPKQTAGFSSTASDARMERLANEADKRIADKARKEATLTAIKVDEADVAAIAAALALTPEQATRRLQEAGGKAEKVLSSYMKTGVVSAVPVAECF